MIVVVPVTPPRDGHASIAEHTGLDTDAATTVYEASVIDVCRAVTQSGGELLVNYRDEATLPAFDGDAESAVRELVTGAIADGEIRFERQVGSSRSARLGNTVTHLLEREKATAVGVLEPTVPLVRRAEIDSAAMALRRHDVVLGPSTAGSVFFAGFTEPIDFTDSYATPALESLAAAVGASGLDLGFAPSLPAIDTEAGLSETIATLNARDVAGRPDGEATAEVIAELGLEVDPDGCLEWPNR